MKKTQRTPYQQLKAKELKAILGRGPDFTSFMKDGRLRLKWTSFLKEMRFGEERKVVDHETTKWEPDPDEMSGQRYVVRYKYIKVARNAKLGIALDFAEEHNIKYAWGAGLWWGVSFFIPKEV